MTDALFSMLIAFGGYSLRYISSACQKVGLEIRKKNKVKGWFVWIAATALTSASVFVVLYAVSLGNVSIVGAMAGTGLIALAVFSAIFMKEQIRRRELLGVVFILVAAALIALFSNEAKTEKILFDSLFVFLAVFTTGYVVLWIVLRNNKKILGVLIGAFAGTLSGFVPVFQKASTTETGRIRSVVGSSLTDLDSATLLRTLEEILLNPFALLWVFFSVCSMIVIQFAYKHDRAIRIIPAFSASYLVIPVVLGVVSFQETLSLFQWLGMVLILVGVLFLTMPRLVRFPKSAA